MNPSRKPLRTESVEAREDAPDEGRQSPGELALPLFHNAAELVRYIREARRLRDEFFEFELFGEPGWDILLDLYNAELAQQRLPISSIGLSSGIAPTTTIRWLSTLESKGLVRREPDPLDGRRFFASLTPKAVRGLDTMFAALWDKMAALQLDR